MFISVKLCVSSVKLCDLSENYHHNFVQKVQVSNQLVQNQAVSNR